MLKEQPTFVPDMKSVIKNALRQCFGAIQHRLRYFC